MRPPRAVPGLVMAALSATAGASLHAQIGLRFDPDDRVVVGSFALVTSMARDESHLYAVSEGGLLILDLFSGRWGLPSTLEDGFPGGETPSAVAFDPFRRFLWMGTVEGGLYSYHVDFRQWNQELGYGHGPVLAIGVPRGPGDPALGVRTTDGWVRVDPGGFGAGRIPDAQVPVAWVRRAGPVEARLRAADPALLAVGATITIDRSGRRWPITDVARGERPSELFLATAGGGVFRYDRNVQDATAVPFGLPDMGVGAVTTDGDWVWYAGDGRGRRRGIARSDHALERWEIYEAPTDGVPDEGIHAVLPTEAAVWFATDRGVVRFDRASRSWQRPVSGGTVRDLAPMPGGGVVAAGQDGLMTLDASGGTLPGPRRPVTAVARWRDEVWSGGRGGLWRGGGATPVGTPVGTPGLAGLGAVVGLAGDTDRLWVATEDALWVVESGEPRGPLREVGNEVGRIRGVTVQGGLTVVFGALGVAVATRGPPAADQDEWFYLVVGEALPAGPVADAAVTDEHLVLATPAGAIMIRRRALP